MVTETPYQSYLYLHVYRNAVSKLFIFTCLQKCCIKIIYLQTHYLNCLQLINIFIFSTNKFKLFLPLQQVSCLVFNPLPMLLPRGHSGSLQGGKQQCIAG